MAFSDTEEQTAVLCSVLTDLSVRGIRLNSAQLLPVLCITLSVLPELNVLFSVLKKKGVNQFCNRSVIWSGEGGLHLDGL